MIKPLQTINMTQHVLEQTRTLSTKLGVTRYVFGGLADASDSPEAQKEFDAFLKCLPYFATAKAFNILVERKVLLKHERGTNTWQYLHRTIKTLPKSKMPTFTQQKKEELEEVKRNCMNLAWGFGCNAMPQNTGGHNKIKPNHAEQKDLNSPAARLAQDFNKTFVKVQNPNRSKK